MKERRNFESKQRWEKLITVHMQFLPLVADKLLILFKAYFAHL